jgi:hypothetical protein
VVIQDRVGPGGPFGPARDSTVEVLDQRFFAVRVFATLTDFDTALSDEK